MIGWGWMGPARRREKKKKKKKKKERKEERRGWNKKRNAKVDLRRRPSKRKEGGEQEDSRKEKKKRTSLLNGFFPFLFSSPWLCSSSRTAGGGTEPRVRRQKEDGERMYASTDIISMDARKAVCYQLWPRWGEGKRRAEQSSRGNGPIDAGNGPNEKKKKSGLDRGLKWRHQSSPAATRGEYGASIIRRCWNRLAKDVAFWNPLPRALSSSEELPKF